MSSFDVLQLFAPAPSGVQSANPAASPTTGSWLANLLLNAQDLGLSTTAWQPGGMVRTILSIMAVSLSVEDNLISAMAQGGFLDWAASGTVTVVNLDGTTTIVPVSPDPSIVGQNPNGTPTWLDVLADGVYNCQRQVATQAPGNLAVANSTTSTYGPFAAGTFHVQNTVTGSTYANQGSLTIGPASYAGGGITAATNASPILITTASAHGLSTGASVLIDQVTGNTAANGFWTITVVNSTQFLLTNSTGNGSYVSGGRVNVCTVSPFVADLLGPVGTAATGTITTVITTLSGVSCSNLVAFFGQAYESNQQLVVRCRAKQFSVSVAGPSGAYQYYALTSAQILAGQVQNQVLPGGAVPLSAPVNRVAVQTPSSTGLVNVVVASSAGAVPGLSQVAVTGATNASPIVITVASTTGLANGNYVTVSGVEGNTNANGTFTIAGLTGTTFQLVGTTGNAAYTLGGVVEAGDLGQVDRVIQAFAVPDGITALTSSAVARNVAIVGTVTVPLAQVAAYTTLLNAALATYFSILPINGVNNSGVLRYNDVLALLYAAGSVNGQPTYVTAATLTLNGGTADISYSTPTTIMVMSPAASINVVGA